MHVHDLRLVELVLRQRVLDGEFAAHVDGHHVGESTSPDGNDRRSAGHSGNGAGGVDLGDGRVARLERDCTIAVAALQVGDDGVRPADVHVGLMLGEVETGQQHAGRDLGVGEHALVDLHLVDQASEAGAADHVDRGDDIVHLRPRVRRADLRAVDVHGQSGCLVLSPRDVIPRARLEVVPEGEHVAAGGADTEAGFAVGVHLEVGRVLAVRARHHGRAAGEFGVGTHPVADRPRIRLRDVVAAGQGHAFAVRDLERLAGLAVNVLRRGVGGAVAGTPGVVGVRVVERVVVQPLRHDLWRHGEGDARRFRRVGLGRGGDRGGAHAGGGHHALGGYRGDAGLGRAPCHGRVQQVRRLECRGQLLRRAQHDLLVAAVDGNGFHRARALRLEGDVLVGERVEVALESAHLIGKLRDLRGGQIRVRSRHRRSDLRVHRVGIGLQRGDLGDHEPDLVHVAHALGDALQAHGRLGHLVSALLARINQERVAGLEGVVRGIVERVGHPCVVRPAQEAAGLLARVDHRPVAFDRGGQRKVAGLMLGAGVQRGAKALCLTRLDQPGEVGGMGRRRGVADVQVGDAQRQVELVDEAVHRAGGLQRHVVDIPYRVDQVERVGAEAALVDADVRLIEPALVHQMLDELAQEVGPHAPPALGSDRVFLGLHRPVLPVREVAVPGRDAVYHDLVADAESLVERHPLVEVGEVVGEPAPALGPLHHRRVVDGVGAVGLAGPCVLVDSGCDGVAADGLVQFHA